jgi:hypothetical protein
MHLALVSMFVLTSPVDPADGDDSAPKFEARVIKALEDVDRPMLKALAAEFAKMPAEVRRDLPIRVREDSVEFAFRGTFPGNQFSAEMLEYLVSVPDKDYESLLVVPAAEQARVQALRPFFAKRAGDGRRKWWSAQLLWTEGDAPHSVTLSDLLVGLDAKERVRFLDQIGVNNAGVGGEMNVAADPVLLPRKRVAARLLLTIRIQPEG